MYMKISSFFLPASLPSTLSLSIFSSPSLLLLLCFRSQLIHIRGLVLNGAQESLPTKLQSVVPMGAMGQTQVSLVQSRASISSTPGHHVDSIFFPLVFPLLEKLKHSPHLNTFSHKVSLQIASSVVQPCHQPTGQLIVLSWNLMTLASNSVKIWLMADTQILYFPGSWHHLQF